MKTTINWLSLISMMVAGGAIAGYTNLWWSGFIVGTLWQISWPVFIITEREQNDV